MPEPTLFERLQAAARKIPGIRQASINGQPMGEVEYRTKVAADATGKDLAAKYPAMSEAGQRAGAAIENLQAKIAAAGAGHASGPMVWDHGPSFPYSVPAPEDTKDAELEKSRTARDTMAGAQQMEEMEAMRRKIALTQGN